MKIPKPVRQHWIYKIWGHRKREGNEISEVRMSDLQVVKEEWNTRGGELLAG